MGKRIEGASRGGNAAPTIQTLGHCSNQYDNALCRSDKTSPRHRRIKGHNDYWSRLTKMACIIVRSCFVSMRIMWQMHVFFLAMQLRVNAAQYGSRPGCIAVF